MKLIIMIIVFIKKNILIMKFKNNLRLFNQIVVKLKKKILIKRL